MSKISKPYFFLAILAVTVGVITATFLNFERPVSHSTATVSFTVPYGATARAITGDLAAASLIRSAMFSYYAIRILNLDLKAGTYLLSPSMSTFTVLKKIVDGKQEFKRITFPEGLSLIKTARHLEEAGITGADSFLAAARDPAVLSAYGLSGRTAEGFLFPDTYFFPIGMDAREIVRSMIETFFKKVPALANAPDDPQKMYEKVILASIVEREYRVVAEAPLIASVFINRLRIGMGLQSCATVEYIITEIRNQPHPSRLTLEDLSIRSDYNTYLWAGLPPSPICSPGLIALEAVFSPADTNYLYFRLTDADAGTHSFTRSLDEHVEAGKQIYLKKAAGK